MIIFFAKSLHSDADSCICFVSMTKIYGTYKSLKLESLYMDHIMWHTPFDTRIQL